MKVKWLILLLLLLGCQSQKIEKVELPPPPPFPKHLLPPVPPPNFTPNILDTYNIQINSVPHPLNIGQPYIIWVNKKSVNIGIHKLNELMSLLDLPDSTHEDTAGLNGGSGWLRPFDLE